MTMMKKDKPVRKKNAWTQEQVAAGSPSLSWPSFHPGHHGSDNKADA